MIEILHVITGLDAGGAERQLAMLCQNTDPTRIRHRVVSMTGSGVWGEKLRQSGIDVRSLNLPRGSVRPLAIWRLAALIRDVQPAIVESWLYHADLLAFLALQIAQGPKLLWTIRCSDMNLRGHSTLAAWVVRLLARVSRCPAAVIANSQQGRDAHHALGYRPKEWRIIPNGIDAEVFHPDLAARDSVRAELGLESDAVLVGNFSRHDPMKDHPTGLAAFKTIAENAWLVLAGSGTGPENPVLTKEILNAGLDRSRVKRLGPRPDIPRLTAALDVALSSSAFGEGFSNVLAEAMACGIPCVATRTGDTEMLMNGMVPLAAPGDSARLAAGLTRMIGLDANQRADLANRLRRRAEDFSIARMVAAYSDLYRDIVGLRQ
jgi:glycosyltransferase involved in cell wall biosynthesis